MSSTTQYTFRNLCLTSTEINLDNKALKRLVWVCDNNITGGCEQSLRDRAHRSGSPGTQEPPSY